MDDDHLHRHLYPRVKGDIENFGNNSVSAQAVKEYLERNMIEAIHSTEPTLETAFIELTGKGLELYEQYSCDN